MLGSVSGVLYVVATPIGNLGDITFRAVEVLKSVARIACEDTRHTRKLLDHYGIKATLVSCHEHNEAARAAEIVARLESGESMALVTDAGTPLLSDPGERLVRAVLEAGLRVVPIPGANAAIAALSAAGLSSGRFRFLGFLPPKRNQRVEVLKAMMPSEETLVCYEAPHRVIEALRDIAEVMADPQVVVARELTKLHEEFLRDRASAVAALLEQRDSVRGEFTLLIAAAAKSREVSDIVRYVRDLESTGMSRMDAIKKASRDSGLPKREVYRKVEAASS